MTTTIFNEVEVKGKDFSQMVDELLRRHGFDAQQQQVLLAPPNAGLEEPQAEERDEIADGKEGVPD